MTFLALLVLSFISVSVLFYTLAPFIVEFYRRFHEKKAEQSSIKLEELYLDVRKKRLFAILSLAPLLSGIAGAVVFRNLGIGLAAAVLGFIAPSLVIRSMEAQRKEKLNKQMVDILMILSSSLKAGLTLLQAIETVVEEMPPPASQEFSMVAKEMRMGLTIEDALKRLNKRISLEELKLMSVAIIVARETGGNLVMVFDSLTLTIREKMRVREQIKTLTLQGKWQGMIMSLLPIIFAIFVYKTNPAYFEYMLAQPLGRGLLIYAGVSMVIGIILIHHISSFEDF